MILKLRTGIEKNLGWKIIGCVEQIDYKYIDEPKELCRGEVYINVFPDVPDKRVTKIIIFRKNGPREVIYTDDAVYILNNDGKTCDTINI